jgi:formamidopyrimidine-DNA glycosylase
MLSRARRGDETINKPGVSVRATLLPMPELAEVEYYRRRWDSGLRQKISDVQLHAGKRIFRGTAIDELRQGLIGRVFLESQSRGKQLLFRFSKHVWLGLHLGMTGKLYVAAPDFHPGKHDHLVLYQAKRALIFQDARQFGRVRFHNGPKAPAWWEALPPAIGSPGFIRPLVEAFLRRHRKLPIKASLLLQSGFPGVGNWMADEILWRAKLDPRTPAGELTPAQVQALWRQLRFVCRAALKHVAAKFDDPPRGWLFHERWSGKGRCPIHRCPLNRATIGGRTTAWCSQCQRS